MTSARTIYRVGCFVGVLSLGLASVGLSAEPSAASQPAAAADTGLEEVLVTAQRRSEDLRNVPIAMTAIAPEELEKLHIQDLASLPMITPDLNFTQGINFTQVYIRGIGSGLVNAGLESPVATYIDGGYVSREFGGLYDILDLSSVEVLKGPQGSLYGRNATGGVMLINTADPTPNLDGRLSAEVGNIGHQKVEGVLNLPISDTLSARFSGRMRNEGGYITDLAGGNLYGESELGIGRVKLAYKPNNIFSAILEAELDRERGSAEPNAQFLPAVYCSFCGSSTAQNPVTDPYTTSVNWFQRWGTHNATNYYNLRLNYDAGAVTIVNTASYRDMEGSSIGDYDLVASNTQIANLGQDSGAKTFTESLVASTNFTGMFNAVGGLDYMHDISHIFLYVWNTNTVPTTPLLFNTVTSSSVSPFVEATLKPADHFKVVLGGRYTSDDRTAGVQKYSDNAFTPRVVVAYDAGSVNLYASYNKGFHAGGFSALSGNPLTTVQPEKITSYEVGAKFESADRRVRSNLAVFDYDYTGVQVLVLDQGSASGNVSSLQNAAAASGKGVEIDFNYKVVDAVELFGGGSFLDAKYTKYPGAQVQLPTLDANGNPIGSHVGFVDLSGATLPHAPRTTAFLGINAKGALGQSWKGEVTGTVHYSSDFDFATDSSQLRVEYQPALTLVNLTAKLMPNDERYNVGLFVDNLTDQVYYNFRFFTAPYGALQNVARPRTYGLSLGMKF